VAHSSNAYSFTPGAPASVPYRPRAGDTTLVDGQAPVALPAASVTASVTPALSAASAAPNVSVSYLRREVYGFLPYWELGSTLDYTTLSTVAYFGIDLNTDGTLDKAGNGWGGWTSATLTSAINAAHSHGTRVALTVESFAYGSSGIAAQAALLSNPVASLTAAQQIAAEVARRGADGVNLDFEPIASGQSANYVTFVRLLRAELDKVHPGYELTFCATGSAGSYDLPNLLAAGAADAVFIMGYNLRGGSPSLTGSIDPMTSPSINYTLTGIVNNFLSQVPASKVILGLPWYGEAWSTGGPQTCLSCQAVHAPPASIPTYGAPAEVYYSTAAALAAVTDANDLGWLYDPVEETAWTAYYGLYGGGQQPTWRQLYFDDARTFGARLDAIDGWNLRGAGIWALGYDTNNGDGDLTNTLAAKFETTGATYVPVTPVRLLDTRSGNGLAGHLSANTPATFQVTGRGGIPASATAVTGNVTVTGETSSWALYLGPDANPSPSTSTINFSKGDTTANGLTVALSAAGTLSATYISTAGNTTDLVFDVTGYFWPNAAGATYHPVAPVRLLDTRSGNGLSGPLTANTPATFQVTGRGAIPANATAVTGNVTVTGETSAWAVSVGPNPDPAPTTSTLNFNAGDVRANGMTVALAAAGTLSGNYRPVCNPGRNAAFWYWSSGGRHDGWRLDSPAKKRMTVSARP
jgi:spore germination protein YaaH